MCHNHSHIKAEATGFLGVGDTTLIEYLVCQPLAVELPYGEKWTRPAGTRLYVPVSKLAFVYPSTRQAMGVSYTSLCYTEDGDTTVTHETALRLIAAYNSGETVWPETATSPTSTEGE